MSGLAILDFSVLNKIRVYAWFEKLSLPLFLCAVVVVASLVLGGGTRGGFLSDVILQLVAIPLLLVSLWRMFETPLTKQMRLALWFCLAVAILPLLQLVPLPSWIWTNLPNRQPSAEAFEVLGQTIRWMPISVSPHATWLTALSLIPPLAIFLGTLLLTYHERRWLSLVVLAVGIVSVFVGLVQVAQGSQSQFRFFAVTNIDDAVGFFANRNHFAAMLYCLIIFAIAWIARPTAFAREDQAYSVPSILGIIGCLTLLVVLLAGEIMARSRAGIGLTMLGLFFSIALVFSDRRVVSGITPSKLLLGAITLVLIFALQFALYRLLGRFAYDPIGGDRLSLARSTIEAARAYMPLGSGLGTFVPVYAMFEKPETVADTYVNHAHNDALELWLETGALGLTLMGLFAIWLISRALVLWRSRPPQAASELDWSLARAATIVAALILIHSFVDYPLRTAAMMAIMAFACALLIEPPANAKRLGVESQAAERVQFRPDAAPPVSVAATTTLRPTVTPHRETVPSKALSLSPDRRWGGDIGWPKEWSDPSDAHGANEPTNSSQPRDD